MPLLRPWGGSSLQKIIGDALPIRWLGALHDLALSAGSPALSAAWPAPDRIVDDDVVWSAAREAIDAAPDHFTDFMSHEPQTNEVRRSACLLPGFLTVADATGSPLRVFEVGASAGLNQLWDLYAYDYGAAGSWGPRDSDVKLDSKWGGTVGPFTTTPVVLSRAACDRKPVDIRDPVARRRLKAYVWGDQFDRLTRLDGAVAMALRYGVTVENADAVSWTAANVAPADGAATVLAHSVFWQYMPAESQTALAGQVADLGDRATRTAPFAWLRMEPASDAAATMELCLTLWPEGRTRRLAVVHPHGAWVDWDQT